jgi:hypothetical protein
MGGVLESLSLNKNLLNESGRNIYLKEICRCTVEENAKCRRNFTRESRKEKIALGA